jgi:hypothetical protein
VPESRLDVGDVIGASISLVGAKECDPLRCFGGNSEKCNAMVLRGIQGDKAEIPESVAAVAMPLSAMPLSGIFNLNTVRPLVPVTSRLAPA